MTFTLDLSVVLALTTLIMNGIAVGALFMKLERRLTRLEANMAIVLRVIRLHPGPVAGDDEND